MRSVAPAIPGLLADEVLRDAEVSGCGTYRWTLARTWSDGPVLVWVMLNPSTADALSDDQTVRRIVGFSRGWGFGGLVVVNLHPFRSPRPEDLAGWLATSPEVGSAASHNLLVLERVIRAHPDVVVAWGDKGLPDHSVHVTDLLRRVGARTWCLGRTASGAPIHPAARGRSRVPDGVPMTRWAG